MRRRLKGIAVSAAKEHTVRVRVASVAQHPKYKKRFMTYKDFLAHDETNSTGARATVVIEETRPISRRKRFRVVYAAVAKTT